MRAPYTPPTYPPSPAPEVGAARVRRVPVIVIGGGPVGLTAALDLGRRGHEIVLINKRCTLSDGSRAICFSKRTLDIYDRLGVVQPMLDKGVAWRAGKVFWGASPKPIYEFDLTEAPDQKSPAFINLQQYYLEEYLIEALSGLPNVALRWGHEAVAVTQNESGATVDIMAPDGAYTLEADYVIACDGARSPTRAMLGLDFEGRVFEDNFLIADVRFKGERPAERWFWFEPPFPGASALLHKQPDDVWRLDFQIGWNVDKAAAVKPENVAPFVEGMLGKDVDYSYEWISLYTFQCRRMRRFAHGHVIFAGDAAHLVSPFGARGCNSGVADIDNLGWKLDLVLRGGAPAALLESYDAEAVHAADINILNSTRSTEFITPKNDASRVLRDAVLELATHYPFARPFVNSGRLAAAVPYPRSALSTLDDAPWDAGPAPGWPAPDAPVNGPHGRWLLNHLGGRFVALVFGAGDETSLRALANDAPAPLAVFSVGEGGDITDPKGLAAARFGAAPGSVYLIRPDQYVAARWRAPDARAVRAALQRATAIAPETAPPHAAHAHA